MHLIYMDDSGDEKLAVFSGLAIPMDKWGECFERIKTLRRELRKEFGIYVYKELHAWKFVSGRGDISDRRVYRNERAQIFERVIRVVSEMPGIQIFNAAFPRAQADIAFERLINRIERTFVSWGSHGLLISDEGKEAPYTRLIRKMRVHNPIPSAIGVWKETGKTTKNIASARLIEDPIFKKSDQSYFIQLADFVAFSLLRNENPTDRIKEFGLEKCFDLLAPVLVTAVTRYDKRGILRP